MKIGLMADTHDRLEAIEKAVSFFNRIGVKHVLHAGDLVSPFTAAKFRNLKAKLHVVWGNNDGDKDLLRTRFSEFGSQMLGEFASLDLARHKLALLHGTNEDLVKALVKCELYDIIVRGHTHRAEILEGRALIVNPGEVCGYLSGHQTVSILDLAELRAEIVEL